MSINNWNSKKIIMEDTSKYIEEARGKKIDDPLRAKLMGMEDIRSLKGTMTPRYFATKVIRHLQSEYPELDIDDLTNDDIQNAINVVANISKPLATRSDIQITTRERGAAEPTCVSAIDANLLPASTQKPKRLNKVVLGSLKGSN